MPRRRIQFIRGTGKKLRTTGTFSKTPHRICIAANGIEV